MKGNACKALLCPHLHHTLHQQKPIQLTVCASSCTVQGKGFELEKPEKLWEIGGSEWCAPLLERDPRTYQLSMHCFLFKH